MAISDNYFDSSAVMRNVYNDRDSENDIFDDSDQDSDYQVRQDEASSSDLRLRI